MKPFKPKDPDSRVRRWFKWDAYCAARNTSVVSYELAIDDAPDASLVIDSDAIEGNVISFWIEGGTLERTYVIRSRVTLANGTVDDHSRTQTIAQL